MHLNVVTSFISNEKNGINSSNRSQLTEIRCQATVTVASLNCDTYNHCHFQGYFLEFSLNRLTLKWYVQL